MAKFACIILMNEIRCRHDAGIPQRVDVATEFRIQNRKLVDGNVDNDNILNQIILFVRKRLTAGLHIVQCNSKFTGDGIGCLFPTTGLTVEIVTPSTKHLIMVFDKNTCAHA